MSEDLCPAHPGAMYRIRLSLGLSSTSWRTFEFGVLLAGIPQLRYRHSRIHAAEDGALEQDSSCAGVRA